MASTLKLFCTAGRKAAGIYVLSLQMATINPDSLYEQLSQIFTNQPNMV